MTKYFLVNKQEFIDIGDKLTSMGIKAKTGEVEVNGETRYSLLFEGNHHFLDFKLEKKKELTLKELTNYMYPDGKTKTNR